MNTLLPEGWKAPIGYANGIAVDAGRIVFVAGQVGWNAQQQFESEAIAPQFSKISPLQGMKRLFSARYTLAAAGHGASTNFQTRQPEESRMLVNHRICRNA